jgi:predicted RNA-binding Zn-ribbon protein involved in translation (DUF1610 family)
VTIGDRMVVDLTDVVGVQVECLGCKGAVNFPAEGWEPHAYQCPNCAEEVISKGSEELRKLGDLVALLRTLRTPRIEPGYRIRLQVTYSANEGSEKPEELIRG